MEDEDILKVVDKRHLSAKELECILKAFETKPPRERACFDDYFEKKVKIGVFSDCHIGAKEFDESLFNHMVNQFQKKRVSRVYCAGDILEGMSGRDGQIYDLSEIGFSNQMDYAEKLFKKFTISVYGINGNHDMWYQKKNNAGVNVGIELEKRVDKFHCLGDMEADVNIGPNIKMKLFHANDGTAYAISYKMQKLMESFTGGEKPDILLSGHYHKALYMFNRNIHGLECGTICGQTQWMRGKKIPAHKGFWILEMDIGKGGIGRFNPSFYAGYK